MLKLYQNIRRRRQELGMTQKELAEKTGYTSKTSITKIEAGKVDLSQSKIAAFARALDTTPSDLMGLADEPLIDLPQGKRIPIIGDVACGSPIYHPGDGDEMVTVYDFDQADCAVRARGDSMEPLIQDGYFLAGSHILRPLACSDTGPDSILKLTRERMKKNGNFFKKPLTLYSTCVTI